MCKTINNSKNIEDNFKDIIFILFNIVRTTIMPPPLLTLTWLWPSTSFLFRSVDNKPFRKKDKSKEEGSAIANKTFLLLTNPAIFCFSFKIEENYISSFPLLLSCTRYVYDIICFYNVSDSARTRFEKRYSSFLYFIAFIFCHSCWYLSWMCASDWERERKEKCKKATMIFWASPSFLFSHLKIFVSSPFYFTSPSSSFLSIFHVFSLKMLYYFYFSLVRPYQAFGFILSPRMVSPRLLSPDSDMYTLTHTKSMVHTFPKDLTSSSSRRPLLILFFIMIPLAFAISWAFHRTYFSWKPRKSFSRAITITPTMSPRVVHYCVCRWIFRVWRRLFLDEERCLSYWPPFFLSFSLI